MQLRALLCISDMLPLRCCQWGLQKKSTMQFKALDNVLQTVNRDTGQKEALSYRCADIDRWVRGVAGFAVRALCPWWFGVHKGDAEVPLRRRRPAGAGCCGIGRGTIA